MKICNSLIKKAAPLAILFSLSVPNTARAAYMSMADAGQLPYKMQMHGTALIGDRMYVFGGDLAGGKSTLWTNKVQSAKIDTAASKVGMWREEQPMPDLRSYMTNAVETVNDRIYILGGVVATDPTDEKSTKRVKSVTWTRVLPDGTLETWKKSQDFPGDAVLMAASCSSDDNLFLTGGLITASGGTDQVLACDLSATGEPVNWRVIGRLPIPIYNHGASYQGGRIYVWGGQTGISKPNPRVLSAPYTNGTLGEWRDETPMPSPVSSAACCGINDYIVSVGGWTGNANPIHDIWFAHLGTDGRITGWQDVQTNLVPTIFHSLGLLKDNSSVFVTGGQTKQSRSDTSGRINNSVQAFKIPSPVKDSGIAAGWNSMNKALTDAAAQKKTALIFFYSPSVPACKRIWDNFLSKPDFTAAASNHVLGAVDTSTDSTWSYKLGVFRVPCLVEVTPDGKPVRKSGVLINPEAVTNFLSGKK